MQQIVKEELTAVQTVVQHVLRQGNCFIWAEPYIHLQAKRTYGLYAGICLDEVRLSPEGRQES